MPTPRYLRFARALALCSGLASLPGCPGTETATDAGGALDAPSPPDAPVLADAPVENDAPVAVDAPTSDAPAPGEDAGAEDAPLVADAPVENDAGSGDPCTGCDCGFGVGDAGVPACTDLGLSFCCPVVGPLAPPDLPAWA